MMSLREDYEANMNKKPTLIRLLTAFLLYPEFTVVALIRFHHDLAAAGAIKRLLGKLVRRHLCRAWSCYVSPSAKIGPRLRLPHPCGIVIGDGVEIGNDAIIFQNVTIGQRGGDQPAYPKMGDDVLVGANAVVLGSINVGDAAQIGAGAVVVNDVGPGETVVGPAAKTLTSPSSMTSRCIRA